MRILLALLFLATPALADDENCLQCWDKYYRENREALDNLQSRSSDNAYIEPLKRYDTPAALVCENVYVEVSPGQYKWVRVCAKE